MSVDDYSTGPFLSLARVTKAGHMVVNIEVGNEAWATQNDAWFHFVATPDRDGNEACIGYRYDPSTGTFEQPKVPKDVE